MSELRLPDAFFTDQMFPGSAVPPGQAGPYEVAQGSTALFGVYLQLNGVPVLPGQMTFRVLVKAQPKEDSAVWVGSLMPGEPPLNGPGYYRILIPSEETAKWREGTYFASVVGEDYSQSGGEGGVFVRQLTSFPFIVYTSVLSPRPVNTNNPLPGGLNPINPVEPLAAGPLTHGQ
jgi:hypothetical protein